MKSSQLTLTVLFECPFWIGLFESSCEDNYQVAKVTFGTEPKDGEIYQWLLKDYQQLKFSRRFADEKLSEKPINPKRLQRLARKEVKAVGMGTKAQHALQLQREEIKLERKKSSREMKVLEKQKQFEIRKKKRLEKHKGH